MIIVKGKSIQVKADPEDSFNPSRDLADEMKKALHKLNDEDKEDED